MQSTVINCFFMLHNFYSFLWKKFFSQITKLLIIYFCEDKSLKNITLNYYTGFNLSKYSTGTYFIKYFDVNGTNYTAFNGTLNDILKISQFNNPLTNLLANPKNIPQRKKILLKCGENPIQFNLQILDNYKLNMTLFGKNSIGNLSKIMTFLGIKCTGATIINIFPPSKKDLKIENTNISDLYIN